MSNRASKESLLGAIHRRYIDVAIPQFEHIGTFRIRSLTERERSKYEADCLTAKGVFSKAKLEKQKQRLLILCLVDEEGNQLFSEADMAQMEQLDSLVTGYLFNQCAKHCGFSEEDIESLEKNSGTISAD